MFLEFANFYRRFIEAFSRIVVDLSELLKDSTKEKFTRKLIMIEIAKKSFSDLKEIFTKTSLLRHFDSKLQIMIEIDASEFALFEIISQLVSEIDQ